MTKQKEKNKISYDWMEDLKGLQNFFKTYQENVYKQMFPTTNIVRSIVENGTLGAIKRLKTVFEESLSQTIFNGSQISSLVSALGSIHNNKEIYNMYNSSKVISSYLSIIKENNEGMKRLLKDYSVAMESVISQNMNYSVIVEALKNYQQEGYIDDNFNINEKKLKEKDKDFQNKFWATIIQIMTIVSFLFPNVGPAISKNTPILSQIYNVIENYAQDTPHISYNGFVKNSCQLYENSSLNSRILANCDEEQMIEVTIYKNGWLKVRYIDIHQNLIEGWVLEDNIKWEYIVKT